MLKPRRRADLAQEALGAEGGAEVGVEDLDGDGAVVPEVVRQVHPGHAASSQLSVEAVAAGEAGLECGGEAGQATPFSIVVVTGDWRRVRSGAGVFNPGLTAAQNILARSVPGCIFVLSLSIGRDAPVSLPRPGSRRPGGSRPVDLRRN